MKIDEMTRRINKMREEVMMFGAKQNVEHDKSASYWKRNKTRMMTLIMFSSMTLLFYLLGWQLLFRVSGIILILYSVTNIIKIVGGYFKN